MDVNVNGICWSLRSQLNGKGKVQKPIGAFKPEKPPSLLGCFQMKKWRTMSAAGTLKIEAPAPATPFERNLQRTLDEAWRSKLGEVVVKYWGCWKNKLLGP